MSKTFHIGDLISVGTGILAGPNGMDGVCQILDHLTGDQLFTHQLPAAQDACEPHLKVAFPWLAEIDIPTWPEGQDKAQREASVTAWVDGLATKYGTWHEVDALAPSVWGEHNFYDDLVMLVGDKPIIPVPDQTITTARTDGAVYLMDWPGRPGDKYRPAVVWDGTKECWRYPGSGIRAWDRNGEPEGATYERLYTEAELDQMIARYDFNRVMAGEINSREIADANDPWDEQW